MSQFNSRNESAKVRHLRLAAIAPSRRNQLHDLGLVQSKPAAVMKRADLVGHLSTYLHRTLTGARVTDASNASFMGIYSTLTQKGWNDELCQAVGAPHRMLPDI